MTTLKPKESSNTTKTVKVHVCNSCDKSLFHVTKDNLIICATCRKFIQGWFACESVDDPKHLH